ncbi:MAG: phosphoribosylformylglycinamidine cyclo-ligase [Candidatus Wukongarchaeota archaeon]|nr:phosphoribosylformylglycinamidine cyclo-ligase [Candidatus Wukongarchaeota archaeon]
MGEKSITYAEAGVDIDLLDSSKERILKMIMSTCEARKEVLRVFGHFAGLIQIGEKIVTLHTDGVGTKVLVAQMMDKYDTIGIDGVAMSVNDTLCVGAEPIALVDTIALEKMDPKLVEDLLKGIVEGAKQAKTAIVGGETAPYLGVITGITGKIGFDISVTVLGFVEKSGLILGDKIQVEDVIIGLESSGIHSNGLSLARKVFFDIAKLKIYDEVEEGFIVGEELLKPTKIYVPEVMEIIKKTTVNGLVNITGGGFTKLKRVGKIANLGFELDNMPDSLPIFKSIKRLGNVKTQEMYRTFNQGIGFCIICPKEEGETVIRICKNRGTKAQTIGKVTNKEGAIKIKTEKETIKF